MQKSNPKKVVRPAKKQAVQPGLETRMHPQPVFEKKNPENKGRLSGKVAVITGGDSGIGRAVAVAFANEGANVVVAYLNEHTDAKLTAEQVQSAGAECLLIAGDISKERHCNGIIAKTIKKFGKLDIVVNNAAVQYPQKGLEDIDARQLQKTFETNIYPHFYLSRAALPHLPKGGSIICTTSVTAYRGSSHLIDYSATKGAIVSFVRSLSAALADKGIRVNGVAPGPIWTPLIPATFTKEEVSKFGTDVPLKRAGQPVEVAPSYVFLASDDASYITGQILHPNGGEIVNG
ncbi:NAD(P)-dependent dehydrogenase (short-subunit alcohol dehydrogenase family) [Chitinophaga terrae (ex Kim and Jung 2007)]|uniref:SDR family oxidoreductase n=1 Tax=Chitinophaga terrae (ex Kim and Jung 2007) TaxID=408074 RepID=UPI00277F9059|nr:SDR family oxidoreductase [Chitinophaga terrae (ex Kim and Jung 2007)]MDQ0105677.1 NAD(P)-dependent dehydrogenase (short-subunit alcohol dehydrogenase family) [Chitinophaga terrae (ex Kim and Jung 2007)]